MVGDPDYNAYMFRNHPREELTRWARSLMYFRFIRAAGGHANDGDMFLCSIPFQGEAGLLDLCRKLSLHLAVLPPDTPQPEAGRSYPAEEFAKFRSPIREFGRYDQPGYTAIFGVPVFIWVYGARMEFQLSGAAGDSYEVTEADYRNAKRIEEELDRLGLVPRDPPIEGRRCLSADNWGELWTEKRPEP